MEHQYSSGYAAARADGWCVGCLKREAADGLAVCPQCRESRNIRSRNRTDRQATKKGLLKLMKAVHSPPTHHRGD